MNKIFPFLLCLAASVSHADEVEETGPASLAANMTAQFFDVKPSDVQVVLQSQTDRDATVIASVGNEHHCTIVANPAPPYVSAKYGWLIASFVCDKRG
jgi:hypothetical protein